MQSASPIGLNALLPIETTAFGDGRLADDVTVGRGEEVSRTVAVRGPEAVDRIAGQRSRQFALPVRIGERDRGLEGRLAVAEQVVDVPVAGLPLAAGEFAVSVDPTEATGTERAADVGVGPGGELAVAQRTDLEGRRPRYVDDEHVGTALAHGRVSVPGGKNEGDFRRLEAAGDGAEPLAIPIVVAAALVVPWHGIVLVDVPTVAHVFVVFPGVVALLAAAGESLTRLVAAVGRGRLVALAVPVAVVALRAAVVSAPGLSILGALVPPVEIRFGGPASALGPLTVPFVLEAAAGSVFGSLLVAASALLGALAGPRTPALVLVLLTPLSLALLAEVGLAFAGLVATFVAALEALLAAAALIGVFTVAALAALFLILAAIAATSAILLLLLTLHLRRSAGHSFVDSAVVAALTAGLLPVLLTARLLATALASLTARLLTTLLALLAALLAAL